MSCSVTCLSSEARPFCCPSLVSGIAFVSEHPHGRAARCLGRAEHALFLVGEFGRFLNDVLNFLIRSRNAGLKSLPGFALPRCDSLAAAQAHSGPAMET